MKRLFTPRRSPLHRPWVVWLAVWLALFSALAPTVSYALQSVNSRDVADLHAVCSSAPVSATSGATPTAPVWLQVKAPPSDDSETPLSSAMGGHCQRCLLSFERLITLPSAEVVLDLQSGTYTVPVALEPQFVKSFLELNPPPRGPPLLS
jgi:hypothetical protein